MRGRRAAPHLLIQLFPSDLTKPRMKLGFIDQHQTAETAPFFFATAFKTSPVKEAGA